MSSEAAVGRDDASMAVVVDAVVRVVVGSAWGAGIAFDSVPATRVSAMEVVKRILKFQRMTAQRLNEVELVATAWMSDRCLNCNTRADAS